MFNNMPARLKWAAMLNPDLAPMVAQRYGRRGTDAAGGGPVVANASAGGGVQATAESHDGGRTPKGLRSRGSQTPDILLWDENDAKRAAYQEWHDDQKRLGRRGVRTLARFKEFFPLFLEQYQPFYQKSADQAALQEQGLLSSIGSGTGRSGLSGSGMEQYAQWSARGQRNASTSDALTEYYSKAINDALNLAMPKGRNNPDQPNDQSDLEKWGPQILSMIGTGLALSSDANLKADITPLNPVTWKWNAIAEQFGLEGESHGLIAQDVAKVWPDAVVTKNGYLAVDYPLVAARLAAVAKQQAAALARLGVPVSGGI